MPSCASETRFMQLMKSVDPDIDDGLLRLSGATLQKRYTEPQRHYHTLEHLSHMLAGLDREPNANATPIVELAIWFHDCVYDPVKGGPWNEWESIRVWEDFADATASQATLALKRPVTCLIEATIVHQLPTSLPEPLTTEDAARFLDLDMAILADSPAAYDKYARDIRREYAHISAEDYRRGRAKVLQSFLAHERVYLGRDKEGMEARARENIRNEIVRLEDRATPLDD